MSNTKNIIKRKHKSRLRKRSKRRVLLLTALTLFSTIGASLASFNKTIELKPNIVAEVKQSKPKKIKHLTQRQLIDKTIIKYSKINNVDPKLIHSIIKVESNYKPNAKSSSGATGLMQIMPRTARAIGYKRVEGIENNIACGSKYLRYLKHKFKKDKLVVASYNAGEGNVVRYGYKVPPYRETLNYVSKVCGLYDCD